MMKQIYKARVTKDENYAWHLFFGEVTALQKDASAEIGSHQIHSLHEIRINRDAVKFGKKDEEPDKKIKSELSIDDDVDKNKLGNEIPGVATLTPMSTDSQQFDLPFFSKLRAIFNVYDPSTKKLKKKQVEVVVFNQKSNPDTTIQSLVKGQFDNFSSDSIFSYGTLTYLIFLAMVLFYMFGQRNCDDINK